MIHDTFLYLASYILYHVRISPNQKTHKEASFLEQTGLKGEVNLKVQGSQVIIQPVKNPRQGWEEAFHIMAEHGDDQLLDEDLTGRTYWDKKVVVKRFDVYLINLDPAIGSEIQIVLDQIRTVDKLRLVKRLGQIDKRVQ